MEERINILLPHILKPALDETSLYHGTSGQLLLRAEYHRGFGIELDNEFTNRLQLLADNSAYSQSPFFAGGKAGVNWLFSYLHSIGIIDQEDNAQLQYDVDRLQQISLFELSKGNWDFLHGALGIAYYLLFGHEETRNNYFQKIFLELQRINSRNEAIGAFPRYCFKRRKYVTTEVDLGLAHGIPSILKFCLSCYRMNIIKEESSVIAMRLINFIISAANTHTKGSRYPPIYIKGNMTPETSRLAWCYGDIGIGIILFQTGLIFKDQKLTDFAFNVLASSTARKTFEQTQVCDGGICHGSTGIAHVYNRMWHYTKDPKFKDATDFWIERTLDSLTLDKEGLQYKRFNPLNNSWETDYGLLNGTSGIGLVLLSYLTGDFSWDFCLMLND